MSRAYKIKVSETLSRILRAKDGVSMNLDLLQVLPLDQMADLIAKELVARGYEREDGKMVKNLDGVIVSVDCQTSKVSVSSEECKEVELEETRHGTSWEEIPKEVSEDRLRQQIQDDLCKQAEKSEQELQAELTGKIEAVLADVQKEMHEVSNRATAAALKIKSAQIGQIKELTESEGSMTIVLEV